MIAADNSGCIFGVINNKIDIEQINIKRLFRIERLEYLNKLL
jgi:hypothetical protein